MAKVYATTHAKSYQSLLPAEEFGEVTYIFPPRPSPWKAVINDAYAEIEQALSVLEEFNPEEDYFLPIGDMSLVTICASLLGKNPYRLLIWHPHKGRYFPIKVEA